jgi:hypothetical protein
MTAQFECLTRRLWDDMLALKLCVREAELLIEGKDDGFPADPFARRERTP